MDAERGMPPPYQEKFTIALLGKSVQLKNKVGNLILGSDTPFFTDKSNSLIKETNNNFLVINTPDFFDENCKFPDQQVIDFLATAYPSPHLFILVIDPRNPTLETVLSQISMLEDIFGENIRENLVAMWLDTENPISFSHMQERINVKLIYADTNLAEDCKKLCQRTAFQYAFRHYSKEVVQGRRQKMEEKSKNLYETIKEVNKAGDMFNIVLLGVTGAGKSASANTILAAGKFQGEMFHSKASSMPVTTKCESRVLQKPFGRLVRVVDTPDFFNEDLENAQATLYECKKYCWSQQSLILLVMQLGRITDSELLILENLEHRLGQNIWERTMLLLSHGDDLKGSLVQYVQSNGPLSEIVQKCNFRYHSFNNKSRDPKQVVKLIKKIPGYKHIFPNFEKIENNNECKLC